MNFFISTILILSTFLSTYGEEIRLLDLEPTDAQQYIDKQDTTLKYAPKIESNVPAVRILGKEPHNVLEDIYLANQYHGQDGLGGYLYGYSVPDIAKTEKKKAGGDLRGAYNYIAGDGQEIKVEYWDDGTGFHQIDNVPKILPKQIEDSPEVKAAKEEHLRRWHEEAERNSKPIQNPYNSQGQYAQGPLSPQGQQQHYQQYQGQSQQLVNQYQQQKHQFPIPGQSVQYHGEQGQQTQQINRYQQGQVSSQFGQSGQSGQYSGGVGGQYGQHSGVVGGQIPQGGQSGQHSGGVGGQFGQSGQSGQYSGGVSGQFGQGGQSGGVSGQHGYGVQPGGPSGQYNQGGRQSASYQAAQSSSSYQTSGQYGGSHQSGGQYGGHESQDDGQYNEKEEEQGPPKGFFYSFDYPVGIIVQKDGGPAPQKRDVQDVYAVNKANFEQQLQRGQLDNRSGRSASGYLFIKE